MTTISRNRSAMRPTSMRSLLLGSAATLFLSGMATPALAQDTSAEDADDQRGDIIVTARAKAESLQETPVNITSIGGETLDAYQVNEVADVVGRVPSLNVQVGGSGAGAQISLRGLGSSNISSAFDSAVGLDFDGIQVSTQRLLQSAFFDVEQIDVLKGPQSLFFGKSASAGVLALRSANPTDDWEISGKGAYEFEEEAYTISAIVSGPITDTLGIRVAAQYQDIEKYVELEPQVVARDPDKGVKNFVGRVTLQWDPADNFSANLKLNYNEQDSETILGHSDLACGGVTAADTSSVFGGVFTSAHSCNTQDGLYPFADGNPLLGTVLAGTTGDGRDLTQPYNETEIIFARLEMEVGLTDNLTLTSRSGFVDLFNEYNGNFNYTSNIDGTAAGFMAPFRNELTQFTQEFRLASDFDGSFNFMLGAFWEDRKIPYGTSQNAFTAGIAGPSIPGGETFDWYAERDAKARALSFFGSATLDITDQLELSGGLRWTDESKSTTIAFPFVHSTVTAVFGFVGSGFFAGPVRFSDSNLSPEVSLKYQVSDDVNIYAAYKTGFKSGGIDNNALPSALLNDLNDADPAVVQAAGDALRFASETSEGGEIGIKTQFADRTVTFNAVAFYYAFDDLQIQEFDIAIFNFQTFNASSVTTKGIDIDWAWETPLEGLRLSGAASYTDTKYTADITRPDGSMALVDGRATARAPKFSGNIAFDWNIPLGSLQLGLGGNASYSGGYFTNSTDNLNRQSSYVAFDGGISIGDADDKWKLSLIGTNLTDELWTNTAGNAPFTAGDRVVTQNRGRQVAVEAAFKF